MVEDKKCLWRVFQGYDSDFNELFLRYRMPLQRYLNRKIGDRELAKDIVQETFYTVYLQAKQGNIPDHFKSWLYKLADNLCKDYWKKASTKRESPIDMTFPDSGTTCSDIEQYAEREWIRGLLSKLSPKNLKVINLYYFADMKYEEIASILNTPVNTIKVRKKRGLEHLERMENTDERQGRTNG
jgi:RNA polymerase sigma factor (sigma-70 family)